MEKEEKKGNKAEDKEELGKGKEKGRIKLNRSEGRKGKEWT